MKSYQNKELLEIKELLVSSGDMKGSGTLGIGFQESDEEIEAYQ